MKLPPILYTISEELLKHGAKAILVGGSVRDYFLGLKIKDYDIEIYGLKKVEDLEKILLQYGKVKLVGKSFGVLKFIYKGAEYDFAFPRVERKTGKGHRGFTVTVDGEMDFQDAARRRDFTINAMGYDILQKSFLDPFGGKEDLKRKILRHIDDKTFVEDPLRLYRGVQFCARFELTMHISTRVLCKQMVEKGLLDELPKERVFAEIKKLLLKAGKPSVGFELLKDLGALRYFPHLSELDENVWADTMKRLDAMASLVKEKREKDALVLILSALSLNLGSDNAKDLVLALSDESQLVKSVVRLVQYAPEVSRVVRSQEPDSAVRKLSINVSVQDLVLLAKADDFQYAAQKLEETAKKADVWEKPPQPVLLGRDLVNQLGMMPSPKFKEILDKVYQLQLEGKISSKEEALEFVQKGEI